MSEVVQLAKFSQIRGTGMLCCFHLRLKTSVDLPPKNQELELEPLENAKSLLLVVAITEHNCNQPG